MIEQKIQLEKERQRSVIQLIASENLPSERVAACLRQGVLTWKTVEGEVGRRYHSGCEIFDEIEQMAIDACNRLFGTRDCLVQPVSASIANSAIARYADRRGSVLGFSARSGGHISHLRFPSAAAQTEVDSATGLIDYDALRDVVRRQRPGTLIIGGSSYPREVDFRICHEICAETNTMLWADCAHLIGLIAGGVHCSAREYCDVISGSTYKTMRGPRSGFILFGDTIDQRCGPSARREIRRHLFPGAQSSIDGLLLACKGVCFEESCGEWFRHYTSSVVRNARSLASALINNGMHVVTGGTDTHIVICDLRPLGISGADLERALHGLRIMTNRNLIPGDQRGPGIASGIRLGTAFVTSRGFDEADCAALGSAISRIACDLSAGGLVATARALQVNDLVRQLNETKPVPSVLFQ